VDLTGTLKWESQQQPTPEWTARYHPDLTSSEVESHLGQVDTFLRESKR